MLWDLFCRVIDNHGDLGVCWRLARELADRGETVHLWSDDLRALSWMAPEGHSRVRCAPWSECLSSAEEPDVIVEAFGCEPDAAYLARRVAARTDGSQPVWINLEYLSAEAYVERQHGLASPLFDGPARGWVRHFFYPGFASGTGGLLRATHPPPLLEQAAARQSWVQRHPGFAGAPEDMAWASLFCYEPAGLPTALRASAGRLHWWVTPGRAQAAFEATVAQSPGSERTPSHTDLPYLSQTDFDGLLSACDFNAVRGEDSLVRALWAGRPFVWNIYPQADGAHAAKLDAFLRWLNAPASLARFHRVWNGLEVGELPDIEWTADSDWAHCVFEARARLLVQEDLATQLLRYVHAKRPSA